MPGVEIDKLRVDFSAISLCTGAYLVEALRAGVEPETRGQVEAATRRLSVGPCRCSAEDKLFAWIADASTGLLAFFARGMAAVRTAVAAAICDPWSNGQREGQITKLKLLRRRLYGRGNLDLLRALLGAANFAMHEIRVTAQSWPPGGRARNA